MYFLRQLKKFGISPIILKRFYHAIIESVLTFSITVWFGRASYEEKAQLETLVRCASKIIGLTLPSIESVYDTRCVHKSKKIVRDATHPANHLFELLKSGKRYRSVKSKTTMFRNSFYLEAIRYMNGSVQLMQAHILLLHLDLYSSSFLMKFIFRFVLLFNF